MADHYFTPSPGAAHEAHAFDVRYRGHTLHFQTDAGVFSKAHLDKGTALLMDALPQAFAGRALDLGCGWGPVGVAMAAQWPQAQIVMTDINERAAALSRGNLAANGLSAQVLQGDGLAHLDGAFDLIATNPPIRTGKATVYGLLGDALARLAPGGALYLVIRKQQGADSAQKHLASLGDRVEIVARGGGFRVFRVDKA